MKLNYFYGFIRIIKELEGTNRYKLCPSLHLGRWLSEVSVG